MAGRSGAAGRSGLGRPVVRVIDRRREPSEYSARALTGLAWSQLQQSDRSDRRRRFDRFLKAFPNDPRAPEAALVRGEALEMLDQADPALSMYEMVIEKYAGEQAIPDALWKAARLEQRLERLRQAEAHYRQSGRAASPGSASTTPCCGMVAHARAS